MRAALLLAILLAVTLSGCVALTRPSVPLDREPFTLAPNETFSRAIDLQAQANHRVDWEVLAMSGALRVCFSPNSWYTDPKDRWGDELWLHIQGCQLATPEQPVAVRTERGGGVMHTLHAHCEGPEACAGTASVSVRSVSARSSAGAVVLGLLLLILALRVLADRWDRARIRGFVEDRGGRVNHIQWRPFGRGWFGEKGERIYRVEFTDASGAPHAATFKTSLFSGVWTDALPAPTTSS